MSEPITDTERVDFLSRKLARLYGSEPAKFRETVDRQIASERMAQPPPAWIDLTIEFPPDETPVRVLATDGCTGKVCYCTVAGDWYICCPGHAIHGRLWSEVHGKKSEIIKWRSLP